MHYYQHHIGDFLKDTANLTNEQRAVYLMMLWKYYADEKPITDSCEDLAFAMRSDEKTVHLLLRHFFVEEADGWHQPRCDREIERFHEKGEKAKKSANARWTNAKAMRTHTERNADATKSDANQEPITNNQEPINTVVPPAPKARRKTQYPADFVPNETGMAAAAAKRLDVPRELERFRDHHLSKGSLMADWQAAWRTWMSNARPATAQQLSFRERDELAKRRKFEEMTGRAYPGDGVIDNVVRIAQ